MVPADWFILATIALIAIVDIAFVVWEQSTISRRLRAYGRSVSAFPAAWGVLGGHFWGPDLDPLLSDWWLSIGLLVALVVVLVPIHYVLRSNKLLPRWFSVLYVPLYIPAGIFLWPQG